VEDQESGKLARRNFTLLFATGTSQPQRRKRLNQDFQAESLQVESFNRDFKLQQSPAGTFVNMGDPILHR
jgi:hypothetical protein